MKKLFLALLLTSLFSHAFAQLATLRGHVKTKDGKPVGGASIKLLGSTIAGMTDVQGRYELRSVPFGEQQFEVTSVEVEHQRFKIRIHQANQHFNMTVNDKGSVGIEEVTVSRNTEKRDMEVSGFAVAVIETKEASLRNLTTNELLDRAVGVRVRQNGGIGSNVEYNLNGMSGSSIGIFLDGIAVSTYGSSFNLNNIPPAMIERIEVYKGVLPSHLTGDYVGGAINVVLKKDASANNITVATSYGSFNTFQSDLGATFRDKKTGFSARLSGFYTYTDNSYTTWGNSTTYVDPQTLRVTKPYRAKRFNNDYEAVGGRFEFGFTDVKWADQFFVGYNISDTYNEIPHGITMSTPYVGRFSKTDAHVFSLIYNKRDFLIDGLALNVNAVHSRRGTYLQDTVSYAYNWDGNIRMRWEENVMKLDENGKPVKDENDNFVYLDPHFVPQRTLQGAQQGLPTINKVNRRIYNTRSNLGYMIMPGHRISANHNYESTDRDDNDLLNPINKELVTISKLTKNIVSANYEAQLFKNKLRTNIMGKYTSNRTDRTEPRIVSENGTNRIVVRDTTTHVGNFGYGATFSYNMLRDVFVIASTENSYVAPNDNQLYGDPETNILPNLDLQPERNVNYNLGFRWGMIDLGKHRVSVYASAFWRNGFDKITQRTLAENEIETPEVVDIPTTQYVNLGKTQARGFEAEVMYIFDNRLNAMFNFSKFNNLFKLELDENGNPHSYYNLQVPNEPFFTINANVQYRFNNFIQKQSIFNLYYNTGFVGEFYTVWMSPEFSKTPTQFSHDLGASYRFPSGKLVASVDVKNMFNAEVYDNFMIQKPGRGIYVKLNYTINKFL